MEDVTNFYDVMIDLETTGTVPDQTAVIQIAAIKFNPENRTILNGDMFNRSMFIPPGRYWAEDTRQWWSQQNAEVYSGIVAKMEDPATVMRAFANWCGYNHKQPLRFWAKPISFDWPFVQSYLRQYEISNPFHYRNAMDLNTFIRGITTRTWVVPEIDYEMAGDAHHALMDCVNQIGLLFAALDGKWRGNVEILTKDDPPWGTGDVTVVPAS